MYVYVINIFLCITGVFKWPIESLLRVDSSLKIQAERYQRMRGLWRLGSYCVSGSKSSGFSFGTPAWAR